MDDFGLSHLIALVSGPMIFLTGAMTFWSNIKSSITKGYITEHDATALKAEITKLIEESRKEQETFNKDEIKRLSKWIGDDHKEHTKSIADNDKEVTKSIQSLYNRLLDIKFN